MTRDSDDQPRTAGNEPRQESTVLFLHVPKAGGSTLCNVLGRQYAKEDSYWIRPDRSRPESLQEFVDLDDERKRRLRLVTGHVPYGIHTHLPNPVRYITILRHPVPRIRSLYLHVLSRPADQLHELARQHDVADFARRDATAHLDNGQTRFFAGDVAVGSQPFDRPMTDSDFERAVKNLRTCAAVGVTERFDESLLAMAKLFGWRLPIYSRIKTAKRSLSLTSAQRQAILSRNRYDTQLYQIAEELCTSTIEATGIASSEVKRFQTVNRVAQPLASLYRTVRR